MELIEILGLSGYRKTVHLKRNVQKALKELGLSRPIREVNLLREWMEMDINAVPALRVNGKIIAEKNIPGVEDLKIVLGSLLKKEALSSPFRKMIIPTDFSRIAKNAYFFGLDLAEHKNAGIKLVNCYYPDTDLAFPQMGYTFSSVIKERRELLAQFKIGKRAPDQGGIATQVAVDAEVVVGYPAEELVRISRQPTTDLLVMGTTGAGGVLNQWFGSVSSSVARNAQCPVLLVPGKATYRGFRNVLYASNYEAADDKMLQQAISFAGLSGAQLHMVHVQKKLPTSISKKQAVLKNPLLSDRSSIPFQKVSIRHDDILEALDNYTRAHDIDLIIMATTKRGFWGNVFHRSLTQKMVFQTDTPLLVMHFNS